MKLWKDGKQFQKKNYDLEEIITGKKKKKKKPKENLYKLMLQKQ